MTAIPVHAHRRANFRDLELQADIDRAWRVARLLDSEFQIAGFSFGLDALVGLIPGIGDAVGFLAGLYPIHIARKHNLGRRLEQKMILNLALDALLGVMPFAGDVFDAWFKANIKNVKLLEAAAAGK